jgi:ankyrin repeat protein
METASRIRTALYRGDRAAAEQLAAGGDVDVFDAAALGDADRLRVLLAGDPPLAQAWSDDGFTALHFAAFLGGPDSVRVLLEAGSDVGAVARNEMLVQPLHSAAANVNVESCRLLLEAGADPEAKQQKDFTAMEEAVLTKNEQLITLLQQHGAVRRT